MDCALWFWFLWDFFESAEVIKLTNQIAHCTDSLEVVLC